MADNNNSLGALLDQYSAGVNEQAQPVQQNDLGALLDQYSVANNKAPGAPVMQQEFKPKGRHGAFGNLVYGLAQGAADLVQAPAQTLLNAANSANQNILGNSPDSGFSKGLNDVANKFNQHLHNQEETYQNDTPNSIAAGIGRTISNVAPFIAAPAASGSKLVNFLLSGPGAAVATQPVHNVNVNQDGSNDFFEQKGVQAALGAAGGAIGMGVGKLAKSLATPFTTPEAAQALKHGINLTPFQMLGKGAAGFENKLSNLSGIGDTVKAAQDDTLASFNRAVYKRALGPIGINTSSFPVGNQGVMKVENALSDAYDKIIPKLTFKGDAKFGSELTDAVSSANSGVLTPTTANQFNSIIKNSVLNKMEKNGSATGDRFRLIERDIRNRADKFAASEDPNNQELGKLLKNVATSLRSGLSRSNPEHAAVLSKINEGYANYATLRRAASSLGADEGVINPKLLASAIKAEDDSAGKGSYAMGTALMQDLAQAGKNAIPNNPPIQNSGLSIINDIPNLALGYLGKIPAQMLYSDAGRKLSSALLAAQRPAGLQAILNGAGNAAGPLGSIGASQIANQK